jgi:pyrimidine operon attenuation protein/uracil phosphoribosyltransferase
LAKHLTPKTTILDAEQMARVIRRMAGEIVERNRGVADLMLVGIRTRGVPLAEAIAKEIERMEGHAVPLGALDIGLYRDDLATSPQPVVRNTHLPLPVDGRVVVLCDDVLFTGRTVRAALDHLLDYGRPRVVQLAVLVDRGHRELPIQADVVGKTVPTSCDEQIEVSFSETDGSEQVRILRRVEEPEGPEEPEGSAGAEEPKASEGAKPAGMAEPEASEGAKPAGMAEPEAPEGAKPAGTAES